MSFVQIIELTTDRVEDLYAADAEWQAATAGRNTLRREVVYADRDRPGRYLSICEFDSYDSAMVNSALPETAAVAEKIAGLATGPIGFTDLEVHRVCTDRRTEIGERLVGSIRTGRLDTDLFAADVASDVNVPFALMNLSGIEPLHDLFRQGFPYGAELLEHRVTPTDTGVIVEFVARTTVGPDRPESTYSREVVWMEVTDGRVSRFTLYCTGDWDAATQAEQLGAAVG